MKKVQKFYNETPSPDYELDNFNTKQDLINCGEPDYITNEIPFIDILDRSIPKDKTIIEVGCGTGQIISYLSLRRKCVYGIDFSDSSLNKARALKEKLNLNTLTLRKKDITKKEEIKILGKFDYVLCLGVLHHTKNAYDNFKNILVLLKDNGYIAIGLYNRFGRIPLKIRKLILKIIKSEKLKNRFIKLQLKDTSDKEKVKGWFNDQYLHPHETTHTIGQVLRWFKKNNIEYMNTIPSTIFNDERVLSITGIFNKDKYPYFKLLHQLKWIYTTHKEGGYFIITGKKSSSLIKDGGKNGI